MNPKITPVLEKIAALLKENDMAGCITICNGETVDYLMHLEASWSCAEDHRDAEGNLLAVRLRNSKEEFPVLEVRKERLEKTLGAMVAMAQANKRQIEKLRMVLEMASHYGSIECRIDTLED